MYCSLSVLGQTSLFYVWRDELLGHECRDAVAGKTIDRKNYSYHMPEFFELDNQ